MTRVITYGTYDVLHYGHIRLLERARALGDYLIVGVTSDDFDKTRGKINNQQSLMERVAAVKALGIADEVIVEEYEGQKIDDIKKYNIDIFTVGSDWIGKFDYLNNYCKVVYLPRTEGISSTEIRSQKRNIRIGIVGEAIICEKFYNESKFVNGVEVTGICTKNKEFSKEKFSVDIITDNYMELLDSVDAVYIASMPEFHYNQIKTAINLKKHVLTELPIALSKSQSIELFELANKNGVVLFNGIKTAYATAYERLILLIKSGKIGHVVSIDSTCTSLHDIDGDSDEYINNNWNSICAWAPTALLPIFQILGTDYKKKSIVSSFADKNKTFDNFSKINLIYEEATASILVGKGIKSEGQLIITGTRGYAYIPAPWWKTDYFELRFENQNDNKRYFYQLEGEGIRNEIAGFIAKINRSYIPNEISQTITTAISSIIEDFNKKNDLIELQYKFY